VEPNRRLGDAALLDDHLEDLEGGQVDVSHIENTHITIIHFSEEAERPRLRGMEVRHVTRDYPDW
jgi:hypothetical protein